MKYIILLLISFNLFAFSDVKKQNEIKQSFWQYENTILDFDTHFYLQQITKFINKDIVIFLINDNNINAFAREYGYIGINKGLINAVESEEELLAVIAHEVGHIELKHHHRYKDNYGDLLMLGGMLLSTQIKDPELADAIAINSIAAGTQQKINWIRKHEVEADNYAKKVFKEKNLNLLAMSKFFTRLEQGPHAIEYLQTHPLPINRASNNFDIEAKHNYQNSLNYQILKDILDNNSTYAKALKLYQQNKFNQALSLLDLTNPKYKILIGRIYAKLGKLTTVEKYLSPDDELSKYYLAEAYFINNKTQDAIRILKTNNYIKPNYYYYDLLAKIYLKQNIIDKYHYTLAEQFNFIGDIKNAKLQFNLAKNNTQNYNLKLKINAKIMQLENL